MSMISFVTRVNISKIKILCIKKKGNMKKIILVILILLPCFAQMHVQPPEGLTIYCRPALQHFITSGQQNLLVTYESMGLIFSELPVSYSAQRKLIRTDINACRKFIRRYAPNSILYHRLLQELLLLYDYTKEYKQACRAIEFHNQLEQRHQFAFNNPNIVESIQATPNLYGVERCKYKCRAYFNKVSADLRKVERFEACLHADHSVLKAHNYVYKIELIKIRNYIYHHNIYKFETSYF
jgi:hypothetical protein